MYSASSKKDSSLELMILSIRDWAIDKVELKEAPHASLTGPPRCDALNTLVSDIAEHLLTTFGERKKKKETKNGDSPKVHQHAFKLIAGSGKMFQVDDYLCDLRQVEHSL